MKPIIVVHGGVSFPDDAIDGVEKAAEAAQAVLDEESGTAMDAACEAVVVMEDDGRFDAGKGSYYNLDGEIEMDAAVMDESESCGAVAAIKAVRNPILVAKEVMGTPHIIFAGEGATAFARASGFEDYSPGTQRSIKRLADVKKRIGSGEIHEWASRWRDYQMPGTVGAVVYDGKGGFAAANSTGGTSYQLAGRVGDSAIIGAGLYASEKGAVVATGIGEDIIQKVLSKSAYDKIHNGQTPQEACEWGVELYSKKIPIGVLAVTSDGYGISANDVMPTVVAKRIQGKWYIEVANAYQI
jgi:L-asparaginase/beta-aspartyl-peptidase (threonine type)